MKKRWGSDRYLQARKEYRENLKHFVNSEIEETLDSALGTEFFPFHRRQRVNQPVPSLTLKGQNYVGHARIAKCFTDHHGASAPAAAPQISSPDIPPVVPSQVSEALVNAPPHSSNGPDFVSASLLKLIHKIHPSSLSTIYTDVLHSGLHPPSWRLATVVPLPEANKPAYTHPRSWRSIHFLSVVSKTLERIVLRCLQHSDDPDYPTPPMGLSQFGSRARLGTSNAMQCLLRWRENAHSLGYFTTLISADIEGGLDKVYPRTLGDTHLDPRYVPWIQNWAANRTMRFHHNNRLDPKIYTANRGIPQGSPLSPFLFGAYVKKLTQHRILANPNSSRLVFSNVDDVLICLSSSPPTALETLALWFKINMFPARFCNQPATRSCFVS